VADIIMPILLGDDQDRSGSEDDMMITIDAKAMELARKKEEEAAGEARIKEISRELEESSREAGLLPLPPIASILPVRGKGRLENTAATTPGGTSVPGGSSTPVSTSVPGHPLTPVGASAPRIRSTPGGASAPGVLVSLETHLCRGILLPQRVHLHQRYALPLEAHPRWGVSSPGKYACSGMLVRHWKRICAGRCHKPWRYICTGWSVQRTVCHYHENEEYPWRRIGAGGFVCLRKGICARKYLNR